MSNHPGHKTAGATSASGEMVADVLAFIEQDGCTDVDFARVVKVKPGDQHPHLQRWRLAMAQRLSTSL